MENGKSLQDLIRRNGSLHEELAMAYIRQVSAELERMRQERNICHGDVRPATIVLSEGGKVTLKGSVMSQMYSVEGAAADQRDLKAVHHYLLTGMKETDQEERGEEEPHEEKNDLQVTDPPAKSKVTSTSSYLLAVVGFVMAGSLFWYFFSKSDTSSRLVTGKASFAEYDYEGALKDGVPHGKGTARYHDGRYYQGSFVKGNRNDLHALFHYANGNIFKGVFSNDTIQQGRVDLASKDFYFIGEFSQGKPYSGYWFRSSDGKKVEQVINGKEIML